LAEVLEPVTFELEIEGSKVDLIIPEEFIRDFHFSTDQHLMIMIRVVGGDALKVRDFFEDTEEEVFRLKTVDNENYKIDDEFLLTDMHMDEGPPLGVDIDQEQAMVRLILDFKRE
jgi:hypothetical protein